MSFINYWQILKAEAY